MSILDNFGQIVFLILINFQNLKFKHKEKYMIIGFIALSLTLLIGIFIQIITYFILKLFNSIIEIFCVLCNLDSDICQMLF